jgi:Mce-associated membrane protein
VKNSVLTAAAAVEDSDDSDTDVEADVEGAVETDGDLEGRNARRLKHVRWLAALALVVAVSGAGYEGWLLFQHRQEELAGAQALDAAKKYILVLTSVDSGAVDKNFTEVLDGATGEFKDMYTKSSTQLRQALIDNKAAAHGTVIEAAVKSATQDRVELVLFVDQSVSNASAPQPQLDRSRVTMTMEKVDGRWLASKVELP